MYKYTPEYCKNNKVAILVKTEKDIDGLKKLNCHGHLISLTLYEDGFYTIPSNNTWTHDKYYLLENNYELIESSEFIKNNNMEKIPIEKLKIDAEYVVYLDSKKEWEKLNELCGFNVTINYWGQHCYSPWDKTYSSLSSIKDPGIYKHNGKPSKIITINQIKEYMEQEIIGYKLTKPEYKEAALKICGISGFSISLEYDFKYNSVCSTILKEAGVLDLWFEPVYKEEFKVGDWVIATGENHTENNKNFPTNIAWKISKIESDNDKPHIQYISVDKSSTTISGISTDNTSIRKATPEEIEKAKTKVVRMGGEKGFDLTIHDKKIYHNNEDITGYVEVIYTLYNSKNVKKIEGYDFHIKDIILSKTGCENKETLLSEWLSLYDMIK